MRGESLCSKGRRSSSNRGPAHKIIKDVIRTSKGPDRKQKAVANVPSASVCPAIQLAVNDQRSTYAGANKNADHMPLPLRGSQLMFPIEAGSDIVDEDHVGMDLFENNGTKRKSFKKRDVWTVCDDTVLSQ